MANPNDIITGTRCGRTFRASRRTFAHIDYTLVELERLHPGATMVITQGCYNTGVEASAGTHDYDACLDVSIEGLGWWDAQWFLRCCGWAAWYRHTGTWASRSAWHIHMVSLGYTTRVGIYVPAQVDDYYRHALGLKGQHDSGDDASPFPVNIADTTFDFERWEEGMKEYRDWSDESKKELVSDVVAGVVDAIVDGAKLSLGQAVRQASNAPALVRKLGKSLGFDLNKEN